MKFQTLAVAVAAFLLTAPTGAQSPKTAPSTVDRVVAATFKGASEEWKKRIEQDEAQRLCSEHKGELPAALVPKLVESQKATVVLPADGKVIGNWKEGAKIAQNGRGGQFSDPPNIVGGGNCYACHQLSKAEVSYGTMGPSLNEYGKIRRFREDDAKAAYAKIYNAQSVLPCSNMPRFGLTKALSEQQIKDVVGYLFDPESPVNK
jgi:L-cysteine S-thiosulfotransferase